MTTSVAEKIEHVIDAEREAGWEECRNLIQRRIAGEEIPLSEVKSALQSADMLPEEFDKLEATMRQRVADSETAAALPERQAEVSDIANAIAREQADFDQRMADLNGQRMEAEGSVEDSEHARKRLLKTVAVVCEQLAIERRAVDRRIGILQKILAKPLPAIESHSWQFAPSAEQREHVARAAEELLEKQAKAQAEIERLQPTAAALKQLSLTAAPTTAQVQAILDSEAADDIVEIQRGDLVERWHRRDFDERYVKARGE